MLDEGPTRVVDQISVFLENRPGRLAFLASTLADRGVNLRAMTIAETERFGIARMIVDDLDGALAALHEAGLTASTSQVVAVEVPDRPGGLAHLLRLFDGIVSVEYMYAAFPGRAGRRVLVMKLTPQDVGVAMIRQAHAR
ncbi:MAG TPA: ACT domain-containing protein [Actinomycetaceae bacterium]|nr:ACT domain-containing protein [Actinomycetaceae bacterium]